MEYPSFVSFSLATLLIIAALRSWRSPGSFCSCLYKRMRVLFQRSSSNKDALDGTAIQQRVRAWSNRNETASLLIDLIDKDGAGAWPPRANHDYNTWPAPLRGYSVVYHNLEHLLSTDSPSLDEQVNRSRIDSFRTEFQKQLRDNVHLDQVRSWLRIVEAENWDVLPRDTLNAFWCCVAMCRHAYRYFCPITVSLEQHPASKSLLVCIILNAFSMADGAPFPW